MSEKTGPPLCLNVSSHVEPRFGGIATSMTPLQQSLNDGGRYRSGWAAFCQAEENTPAENALFSRWPIGHSHWLRELLTSSANNEPATATWQNADVVHLHGLWQAHSWVGGRLARQNKRPYIVSAHGMLDEWAFRHNGLKKKIYSTLVERSNLGQANCLRALTEAEVEDYRRFGLRNPVAVIPNGVIISNITTPDLFLSQKPHLANRQRLLFMGRLHPKKGLTMLIEVWCRIAKEFPDASLLIAGPDEAGMQPQLDALVQGAGIAKQVEFLGMMRGEMRDSLLAAADLFLLPSFSEGFSVATLEALGAAKPVLITTKCNFPEIERLGCGWVIAPNAVELENGLRRFFATSIPGREKMGQLGKQLVISSYDWRTIAVQFADLFDWMRFGREPKSVKILNA